MFEHFTFGAQSHPRHSLDHDDFPSPTDTTSPLHHHTTPPTGYPFPSHPHPHSTQGGVDNLAAKLSEQSLQQRSRDELVKQIQAWEAQSPDLEIDDDDGDDDNDEDNDMESPEDTVSLPPSPGCASRGQQCRRLQRQLNVQLQSSETHVRGINALVSEMIDKSSQCRVVTSPTKLYLVSPPPSRGSDTVMGQREEGRIDQLADFDHGFGDDDEDEGFCEGDLDEGEEMKMEMEMSLRRASAPSGIRKTVRHGQSANVVNIGGRLKVWSLPRMRKRKT
jgi:hypothetical protein